MPSTEDLKKALAALAKREERERQLIYLMTDRLICLAQQLKRYRGKYVQDLTADCPHVEICRELLSAPQFKKVCEKLTAEVK